MLDPRRPLAIRLAGLPRTDPYEIRVCTYDPAGGPHGGRLSKLHRLGWSGRTRCHVLFDEAKGWWVRDSGSTVVVQVNGRRVHVRDHSLSHGDRIEAALGLTFTFELRTREDNRFRERRK
jgi:hypothetical protein